MSKEQDGPPTGGDWPDPRLRALQVDELYRFAPTAAGFSYLGALLTLGVLIETGDTGRGAIWFLWATGVTLFRLMTVVAYRRRLAGSDPEAWARLVIAANLLAGIQWGALGTLLFPEDYGYRQIYTIMVITCYIGGSLTAYASVRWAHEAMAIPATIPTATPCSERAANSHGRLCAAANVSSPTVAVAKPAAITRRRPNRSESWPNTSSDGASTIM